MTPFGDRRRTGRDTNPSTMRHALVLLCLLLAAAPTADAQLGRLLDRARDAVSDTRDRAENATQQATRSGPAPALDFGTLLDTNIGEQIYPAEPRKYFLLFPGDDFDRYDVPGRYQLRKGGSVTWREDIRAGGTTGTPAIATLRGSGISTTLSGDGDYTLEVVYQGETVGALPFTATTESSDDPFAPGTSMRIDGPWRTHGYFIHDAARPDYIMEFHTWTRGDETGGRQKTEVSIRRGGQEVAWGHATAQGTDTRWGRVEYRLYTPEGRDPRFGRNVANAPNWTVQDVTPGRYEIVLSTESGGVFRTLSVEGADGAFVPHTRSALDTEPRTGYLTPRRMAGQNLNKPHQLDWVGPETL